MRLALVFAFLAVLAASVPLIASVRTTMRLADTESANRRAGLPVTVEELDAWYPSVTDRINAAVVLDDAFRIMESVDPGAGRLSELWSASDGAGLDSSPALRELVSDYGPVLEKLELASRRKFSRFPIDLTLGYMVELPHLARLRNTARILAFASEDALFSDEPARAVVYQYQIIRLCGSLAEEPTLISQLVVVALQSIALDQLQRTFEHSQLDDAQLQMLDKVYAEAYDPDALLRAMVGERCLKIYTVQSLFNGEGSSAGDVSVDMLEKFESMPRLLRSYYSAVEQLKFYDAYERITFGPEPDWPAVAAYAAGWSTREAPEGMVSADFPKMDHAPTAFVRGVAILRVARTAIAVERYRLENGELPQDSRQCIPRFIESVPEDPATGAPLRYRRTERGYIVYSFGDDLDDDGGAPLGRPVNGTVPGDVAVRVNR